MGFPVQPLVPATVPERLCEAGSGERNHLGVTFIRGGEEERVPFCDLARIVACYGGALLRAGLQPRECVGLILADTREFMFTFLGAMHVGLIPVPIAPPLSIGKLRSFRNHVQHIIKASEAAAVVTDPLTKQALHGLGVRTLRRVLTIKELDVDGNEASLYPLGLDDVAFLQFTSGSTSRPKGVMVSYENLVANSSAVAGPGFQLNSEDTFCAWLPMFHDMGLIGFMLGPVLVVSPMVLMSPVQFLKKPVEWLRMITRHRATITFGPNFSYGLCVKRIRDEELEGLDLSSLRVAGCGAEPIQYATLDAFAEKFAPIGFRRRTLLPAYGMAEHTLAISFAGLEEDFKADRIRVEKLSSKNRAIPGEKGESETVEIVCCGRAFPEHQIAVVDQAGNLCAEREVGEILLSGPSVALGYYKNRRATEQVFRDGWLHTGDLGYLVGDELYVCGRLKDLIIVSGRNYSPTDIEWVASEVSGVRKGNCVAFGRPAVGGGEERVVLCAETREKAKRFQELEKEIKRHVVESLGISLDRVLFLKPGSLPKTSSGKLQRLKARTMYEREAV